jgi:nicotinate-nucleotide pyrophosphorylase (carboxylating)
LGFAFREFSRMMGGVEPLSADEIRRTVQSALAEDIGAGDVTTLATVPQDAKASARVVARERLVVAGLALAEAAFRELSPGMELNPLVADSRQANPGDTLLQVRGQARAILTAERVALNFLQRLSGVATLTAQFVEAIRPIAAKILDTRKTTPGWRRLEKYAVACGGGHNHRLGLFDMVLIKDNHLAALAHEPPHAIGAAIRRARLAYPHLKVEVEAETPAQVQQAIEFGADIILLDNMSLEDLRTAVHSINGKAKSEASGGVTLATVRQIAQTGVDFISVGALTHSARAVDIALDFDEADLESALHM